MSVLEDGEQVEIFAEGRLEAGLGPCPMASFSPRAVELVWGHAKGKFLNPERLRHAAPDSFSILTLCLSDTSVFWLFSWKYVTEFSTLLTMVPHRSNQGILMCQYAFVHLVHMILY